MYEELQKWTPVSEDVLYSYYLNSKAVKYSARHYPRSGIDSFGRWMCSNNWFVDLDVDPSVDVLVTNFSTYQRSSKRFSSWQYCPMATDKSAVRNRTQKERVLQE